MTKFLNTFKTIWSEPYYRFIILFVILSVGLYYFNTIYIGLVAKGGIYLQFLDEKLNYIRWWRHFTIKSTAAILRLLHFDVAVGEYNLKVIGRSGFTLVYTCLGYGIMGVFTAFVLTFPERVYKRFLFLIIGLLTIQLLNTTRLVLLSLFWNKQHPFLGIDHHDLFNYVVYTALIALTYSWLKLSKSKSNSA